MTTPIPNRTEISREFTFEAAHRLPHVAAGHKCARLHGHSFRALVTVSGPLDPTLGWVMDFGELKALVAPVIARLDHYYLNEIEGLENPTSELIAHWLVAQIKPKLQGVKLVSVQVRETCTAGSTVYVDS